MKVTKEADNFDRAMKTLLKVSPQMVKDAMEQEKADRTAIRSFGVELALDCHAFRSSFKN